MACSFLKLSKKQFRETRPWDTASPERQSSESNEKVGDSGSFPRFKRCEEDWAPEAHTARLKASRVNRVFQRVLRNLLLSLLLGVMNEDRKEQLAPNK